MAVDYLHTALQVSQKAKSEHKAFTWTFDWEGQKIMTSQPQTFMNLSGESVQSLMHFYKIPLDNLIVIHDDLDLAFGVMKLQKSRGDGGNNGVKSITEKLGSNDYVRIRVGIGRPEGQKGAASHVLENFSESEQKPLGEVLERITDAIEMVIFEGLTKAMNTVNARQT